MANYDTKTFKNEPAVSRPQAGVHQRCITFDPTTYTSTWAINELMKLAKLPKGAKLLPGGWYIESADIDSNATPTVTLSLVVTDGTTTKTVISASTIGQAGGVIDDRSATYGQQTGWVNYVTTNANFYVALKAAAAVATLQSGNVTVSFKYSTDLESGGV